MSDKPANDPAKRYAPLPALYAERVVNDCKHKIDAALADLEKERPKARTLAQKLGHQAAVKHLNTLRTTLTRFSYVDVPAEALVESLPNGVDAVPRGDD